MKKALVLLCMLAIVLSGATVFAGSIDYLSNQSARYLMTFSRVGATDGADIVTYNPAGTAFLQQGLTIDFSTQTLFKPYSQDYAFTASAAATAAKLSSSSDSYEQSEPTPVLPNLYAVYNFGQIGAGNLAINFQAGIVAGGGTLKWDDGTAGSTFALNGLSASLAGGAVTELGANAAQGVFGPTKSTSLEVSSVYYALGLGASYSFLNNMVAVSLGGRVVMPKRSLKIEGEYTLNSGTVAGEYEYDATGYTPIIGICVKPITGLTIGLRYEFETDLEFEYSQESLDVNGASAISAGYLKTGVTALLTKSGISDGGKFNQNLPAILAAGAEYVVMPGLTVMAQGTYYFMKSADLGNVYDSGQDTTTVIGEVNDLYNNGWEFSIGATYQVMPELKVGAGFLYTSQSAKSDLFNTQYTILTTSANPSLDSWAIGLGGTYTIANLGLDITLTGSWTHYIPEDYAFTHVPAAGGNSLGSFSGEYKKDVYNIGFGIGYHL